MWTSLQWLFAVALCNGRHCIEWQAAGCMPSDSTSSGSPLVKSSALPLGKRRLLIAVRYLFPHRTLEKVNNGKRSDRPDGGHLRKRFGRASLGSVSRTIWRTISERLSCGQMVCRHCLLSGIKKYFRKNETDDKIISPDEDALTSKLMEKNIKKRASDRLFRWTSAFYLLPIRQAGWWYSRYERFTRNCALELLLEVF